MFTFVGTQQGYVLQHLLVVGDHGLQHTLEVAQIAPHGALVEQRCGVLQRADQLLIHLGHVQRQVELGSISGQFDAFQSHVAERQIRRLVVFPRQHGLENRAVGQAA